MVMMMMMMVLKIYNIYIIYIHIYIYISMLISLSLRLGKLLYDDETTPEHLFDSITCMRFEGLYRMKLFDELSAEIQSILTSNETNTINPSDLSTTTTTTTTTTLSASSLLIPPPSTTTTTATIDISLLSNYINYNLTISLRLLLINIKLITGRTQEALEQLYMLKNWVIILIKNENKINIIHILNYWYYQIKCLIINVLIKIRNYKLACIDLNDMINEINYIYYLKAVNNIEKYYYNNTIIFLLLKLSRLFIQVC